MILRKFTTTEEAFLKSHIHTFDDSFYFKDFNPNSHADKSLFSHTLAFSERQESHSSNENVAIGWLQVLWEGGNFKIRQAT